MVGHNILISDLSDIFCIFEFFSVYIDGEFHGEVKVNEHDPKSLQYNCNISISDLKPGQSQTVTVKVCYVHV